MLVACHHCHQQYDVGTLPSGTKMHCRCGVLITVPEARSQELKPHHCASCGGNLEAGAESCGYCGSKFSAQERRHGTVCPECYSRCLHDAKFCSSCGVGLNPQAVEIEPLDSSCPRCQEKLQRRDAAGGHLVECSGCGGVWLPEDSFEDAVERGDQSALASFVGVAPEEKIDAALAESREKTVRYVPCPECGEMMHRKNFAGCSGVIIDWCKGHGYWFDTYELEKILAFIRGGGMDRSRQLQIEKKKAELSRAEMSAAAAAMGGTSFPASPYASGRTSAGDEAVIDLFATLGSLVKGFFKR